MLRSLLFIPGNNPAMLLNADIHGADGIILDLEDAVAIDQKDAARLLVRNAVRTMAYATPNLVIRVNPLDTDFCRADLETAVPLRPAFIMPTKVGSAEEVERLGAMIAQIEEAHGIPVGSTNLMPLLETARGIENAYSIACAPRVRALLLGAEDYTADLHAIRSKESGEIAYARGRVLNAARAAGIEAIDTPFTDVNDPEGLRADAAHARALGFTGKASISPRHIDDINRAFSPSESEVRYAQEVLLTIEEGRRLGKGAVSLRGKMIDKPIVDRARQTLETARALGMEVEG